MPRSQNILSKIFTLTKNYDVFTDETPDKAHKKIFNEVADSPYVIVFMRDNECLMLRHVLDGKPIRIHHVPADILADLDMTYIWAAITFGALAREPVYFFSSMIGEYENNADDFLKRVHAVKRDLDIGEVFKRQLYTIPLVRDKIYSGMAGVMLYMSLYFRTIKSVLINRTLTVPALFPFSSMSELSDVDMLAGIHEVLPPFYVEQLMHIEEVVYCFTNYSDIVEVYELTDGTSTVLVPHPAFLVAEMLIYLALLRGDKHLHTSLLFQFVRALEKTGFDLQPIKKFYKPSIGVHNEPINIDKEAVSREFMPSISIIRTRMDVQKRTARLTWYELNRIANSRLPVEQDGPPRH